MRQTERTITLTDAVVAIAMTLLVLPLVELAPDVDGADLGGFFDENRYLFTSFVISFLVIYVFWRAHAVAFARADEAGVEPRALRGLTVWWLLLIVFLPFPTAVSGHDSTTGAVMLYIGTMLVLSVLTSAMSTTVDRATGSSRKPWVVWSSPAVFALALLVAAFSPGGGLAVLLLLLVVQLVQNRSAHEPVTAQQAL
ncbi:TMEM175 family protein [Spongisporangium articulatum]|uniref:TMEM175 family protein n=1 Tax=Spongisporangium articulatum TaxID=3362603 RepID=A0ABW8AKP2_9ACTN